MQKIKIKSKTKNKKHKRHKLWKKNPYCWICGQLMINDITIDHIIPRSKGGGNGKNLALAHYKCNTLRGNKEQKVIINWPYIYGLK